MLLFSLSGYALFRESTSMNCFKEVGLRSYGYGYQRRSLGMIINNRKDHLKWVVSLALVYMTYFWSGMYHLDFVSRSTSNAHYFGISSNIMNKYFGNMPKIHNHITSDYPFRGCV